MQKIVNIIAIASGAVSLAVVGSGLYVFVNRASITDGIKQQAIDAALGSLGSGFAGSAALTGAAAPDLGVGANDLSSDAPQTTPPSLGL